jgi:hypothetical protein
MPSAWDSTPAVPQGAPAQGKSAWDQTPSAPPAAVSAGSKLLDTIKQGATNLSAGAVRGAGSIGATLLAPIDMVSDALDGKGLSLDSNRQRRADIDSGLSYLVGSDPNSLLYKAGKLGGEVAGTAGAGGVLANGARAIGASPELVASLASGGMRTGGTTGLASAGVRAVGGGAAGLASAGMVNPADAAGGGIAGAALPGVAKALGSAGSAVDQGSRKLAEALMQSAVKPTIKQLKTGDAATAVGTLLDYGISPNQGGVDKIRSLVNGLNSQIADKIQNSGAAIDKNAVLGRLLSVRQQFGNQVSPTADLNAIRGVADDFMAHPNFPGLTIPVQDAQVMKQSTYQVLAKKYGQMGSADTEAQKGLARGLKEEIAGAVPEVAGLNAEESRLLTTLDVTERRALMDANKNPMGLASLTTNPLSWALFTADRSANFKALAARMANGAGSAVGSTAPALTTGLSNPLLRGGVLLPAGGDGTR